MDLLSTISGSNLLIVMQTIGLPGLLAIFWYTDQRAMQRIVTQWKDQVGELLTSYKRDMGEMREMYITNVSLVKKYENLAKVQSETATILLQVMTRLSERIEHNMYCPIIRGDQSPPRSPGGKA